MQLWMTCFLYYILIAGGTFIYSRLDAKNPVISDASEPF